MDEKTLKAFHKIKNEKNTEKKFLTKCKKLEREIAAAEEKFSTLPPLEEITDRHERFKWLETKQQLELLKLKLATAKAKFTCDQYEREGVVNLPPEEKYKEPGE